MSNKKPRIYTEEANVLRNKLRGRDYVLGLDLGVGSIGSAVVALESNPISGNIYPADIVYSGAYIFKASDGAADRRGFRSQRNSLRHRRNRLIWVWKTLAEKGLMLPYSKEDVPDPATLRFSAVVRSHDPYDIRFRGLSEKLDLEDLGYAIYHIANHRGSSSMLSEDLSKTKSKNAKYEKAKELTEQLSAEGKPFITLLYDHNDGKPKKTYRNTDASPDSIAPMPTRDLIENEINALLAQQQSFYPDILTDDYVCRIKKAVLFENEMIVPEAGNCPYFPEERKLPKAAFINEERRLWEALNNIRFTIRVQNSDGLVSYRRKEHLDDDVRDKCFDFLNSGKDLTPDALRKLMAPVSIDDIELQGTTKKDQKIKGFKFTKLRDNPFFSHLDENTQNDFIYIWTNSVSPKKFSDSIRGKYKIEESIINGLVSDMSNSIGIGQYAPCGISAMKVVLPLIIRERKSFDEALVISIEEGKLSDFTIQRGLEKLPYYGEALPASMQKLMGKAWHPAFSDKVGRNGFTKPNTNRDEERFGRIANPVVHQTLNELRHLVNEMINVFGKKPSLINLEIARELKVGAEKRNEMSKDNKERERNNERIAKTYLEDVLDSKRRGRLIKTFRIWEEQGCVCPYCVENDSISVSDIIDGRADLDHIFPRADVPGDPESNLVVSHKECNELIKGKRIPYEALSGTEYWNNLLTKYEKNAGLKKRMWRFTMTSAEYEEWKRSNGMPSRFKTDNAYISLIARDFLCTLFTDDEVRAGVVSTVRGSETAMLRKAWNLQSITSDLAAVHDSSVLDKISSQDKVRMDVRHHALDAIVIAYSSGSAIQRINTMSSAGVQHETIEDSLNVPFFYAQQKPYATKENKDNMRFLVRDELLNHTFVSRKIDHSKNGCLLNGTSYSYIASAGNDLVRWVRKKVASLDSETKDELEKKVVGYKAPSWVNNPEDKALLDKLMDHNSKVYDRIVGNYEIARIKLENDNESLISSGKKARKIDEHAIWKQAASLTGGLYYQIENGSISKMFATRPSTPGRPGNVFDTGNNYCIDFYYDADGVLQGEIIRKIDAMNRDFTPNYKKKGYTLFQRLFNYDTLEVDYSEGEGAFGVKVPNDFKCNRTFVIPITYTVATDGKNIQVRLDSICKQEPKKVSSFMVSTTMKKSRPRIIKLSRMGLVEYVSPVLGDLK